MTNWEDLAKDGVNFDGWDDATLSLLLATARALNKTKGRYVIVGGWVPKLLGGHPEMRHPGTRDVDVLFDGEIASMRKAVASMLSAGFAPSAKHDFQVMLPLKVFRRPFVFNVDFMHPAEMQQKPGLMTEVLNLGIDDRFDPTGSRWVRSIVFRSAPLVFEDALWRPHTVAGKLPDGQFFETAIPLLTEAAFVLSKAESVREAKRPRDAFDIYYVLAGPKGAEIHEELSELAHRHPQVANRLTSLRRWISTEAETFTARVEQYASSEVPNPVELVLPLLRPKRRRRRQGRLAKVP